jgi:hypothetical protein
MKTLRDHRAFRLLLSVVACAFAGMISTTPSMARPDFGVRGGAYAEEDDAFLGAEALFNMGEGKRWFGNPNVEHAFIDNGDLNSVSMDFHYDFMHNKPYSLWAGGGPTLLFRDGEAFEGRDDTDAGVNALFGYGASKGDVRPYAQVKVIVADDTEAVLGAGIRW